jgi:hypothetical protein
VKTLAQRLHRAFVVPREAAAGAASPSAGLPLPVESSTTASLPPVGSPSPGTSPPAVAVLAPAARVASVTAAVAVALARGSARRCALATIAGAATPAAGSATAMPAARRAASKLRGSGHDARAAGRIVWLVPPLAATATALRDKLGIPVVLGSAQARCAELDRVLARSDALLVVAQPDATEELADLVLDSLAALGPPVGRLPAPRRALAALAATGLYAPPPVVRVLGPLLAARR